MSSALKPSCMPINWPNTTFSETMAHSSLAKHFCAICGYRRRKPLPQLRATPGVTNDTTLLHVSKVEETRGFYTNSGSISLNWGKGILTHTYTHTHTHTHTHTIWQRCSLILPRSESWFRSSVFILLYVFILLFPFSFCLFHLPFCSAISQRSTFSEVVYGLKYGYFLRVLFKAVPIRGILSVQKKPI